MFQGLDSNTALMVKRLWSSLIANRNQINKLFNCWSLLSFHWWSWSPSVAWTQAWCGTFVGKTWTPGLPCWDCLLRWRGQRCQRQPSWSGPAYGRWSGLCPCGHCLPIGAAWESWDRGSSWSGPWTILSSTPWRRANLFSICTLSSQSSRRLPLPPELASRSLQT